MDKEQAIRIAERYKKLVAENLPLKSLYLFGSYSRGDFNEDSDIDIAVVVKTRKENFFEEAPLLWKLGRKVSYLIEPIILTEDDNNPLLYDIKRTGILI